MALLFDGAVSGDYIAVTDNSFTDLPAGDWTIGVWIKWIDNVTAFDYILSAGGGFTANNSYHIEIESSLAQTIQFSSTDAGADFIDVIGSTDMSVHAGIWTHIFVVRVVNTVSLYINNVVDASQTNANYGSVSPTTDLNIGRRSDGNTLRHYAGDLGEVFKINRALNSDERQSVVNGGRASRIVADLSTGYYYPLDINGADLSENANNGTLIGPPTVSDNPPIGPYVAEDFAGAFIVAGNTFNESVAEAVAFNDTNFSLLSAVGTIAESVVFNDTNFGVLPINETIIESVAFNDTYIEQRFPFTPQVLGGGGLNLRGDIPRKTSRGTIVKKPGKGSLKSPGRRTGGIF